MTAVIGSSHLACTSCGANTGVIDSRPSLFNEAASIRRRRKCLICGFRFTTYEVISTEAIEAVLRAGKVGISLQAASRAIRENLDTFDQLLNGTDTP